MALPKISQQPILHVIGTPDDDYALRILRAYRENCNCRWVSNTDNIVIAQMNENCRLRAIILDKAIAILEKNNSL